MKLTGYEAIEYAEANGLRLNKYADPTEDARINIDSDEARAIAAEDPRLIWLDVPSVNDILAAIEPHLSVERKALAQEIESWDLPEFEEARRLTGTAGCVWDFVSWADTARCIRTHGKLGGVTLAGECGKRKGGK